MVTGSSGSSRRRPRRRAPAVSVLRIGHRPNRDQRLSTHVALVARAFGAQRLYLHPPDPALSARVERVRGRFGGSFHVEGVRNWEELVKAFDGKVVHLTMYGRPLDRCLARIRGARGVLLVVGGAKVPSELYRLADYNVAIGHQPHSEVAALAIALDRLVGPTATRPLRGARSVIVPSARGKHLVNR